VSGRAGLALCGLLMVGSAAARTDPVDLETSRSAWQFKRSVTRTLDVEGPAPAFVALELPSDVAAHAKRDQSDLRLIAPDGSEVPFVVDRKVEREARGRWAGRLVDVRQERRRQSQWIVDLEEPRRFDRVELEVPDRDFAKRLRFELSDDGRAWSTISEDVGVFDREWAGRVHHTTIGLDADLTGRFLRLSADDTRSSPITIVGVTVSLGRRIAGDEWRQAAALEALPGRTGVSRYRIGIGFPVEELRLDADDAAFHRRVVVFGAREANGHRQEEALAEATLYRLSLEDEALSGESLKMEVDDLRAATELVLEVHDGDSPPLHNPRLTLVAAARRLLFPASYQPLTLYYGNPATRPPLYDLDALRERVARSPRFAQAALGAEATNPRFERRPPLPFAAAAGAPLEASEWRYVRPLRPVEREDLYTLRLQPDDLAALRPDLADLRVADAEGRQVPYVLKLDALESWVELDVEKAPSHEAARRLSRYRLRPRLASLLASPALPLQALELDVAEPFFSRPATVLAEPEGRSGLRHGGVLFAGSLSRGGAETEAGEAPVVLALTGTRHAGLLLEVDEGDDAPLTLRRARARVLSPRIVFKARPGEQRLLLGHPEARAPRYDLATLQQELVDYSAVVLEAGDLADNPTFRRGAADYLRQAPPTLLLWGVLLAAAVILLALTARILRRGAGGGSA
jgi:hypothetical protein